MGWLTVGRARTVGRSSADGDDDGAQAGVGCEDAVAAVAEHMARGHEGDGALVATASQRHLDTFAGGAMFASVRAAKRKHPHREYVAP